MSKTAKQKSLIYIDYSIVYYYNAIFTIKHIFRCEKAQCHKKSSCILFCVITLLACYLLV